MFGKKLAIIFLAVVGVAWSFRISPPSSFPNDFLEPTRETAGCSYERLATPCNASFRYRSYSGVCNNLNVPHMGSANTTYKRMFEDAYKSDASEVLTTSPNGTPLPNARTVTQTLFTKSGVRTSCPDDFFWPNMMITFCQFVTHDIASAVMALDANGHALECPCNSTSPHPECMSLPINDPTFPGTCMQMPRSASANDLFGCQYKRRQSINAQTAFLDLSHVYGRSDAENAALRTRSGGELLTSPGVRPDCPYMPVHIINNKKFFIAGDERANENMGLAAVHTLFMREHNKIAQELAKKNSTLSDEILFQEARRINIAQYQQIIYDQLVPVLVGDDYAVALKCNLASSFSNTYDSNINASIAIEFSVAAFRFGHAIVRNMFVFTDSQNRASFLANETVRFGDMVENTDLAYIGKGLEVCMNGLLTPAMSRYGNCFADSLVNGLFVSPAMPSIDLPAMNTLRGREVGCPTYKFVRDTLNIYVNQSNRVLSDSISLSLFNRALTLYGGDITGIDLFVGGIMELVRDASPHNPVLPSTTFSVITCQQFAALKAGDRFWFENPATVNPGAFTSTELNTLRSATLSKLICKNFPDITVMLPDALVKHGVIGSNHFCNSTRMAPLNFSTFRI